jgi:hypothetical protein
MAKKVPKRRQTHNHVRKLLYLQRVGAIQAKPGDMSKVDVAHDDWCHIWDGGYCQCDPDVTLKWSQLAAARN